MVGHPDIIQYLNYIYIFRYHDLIALYVCIICKKHKEPGTKNNIYFFSVINSSLVVSTHLKNISQNGNPPQVVVKTKIFETTT